MSIKPLKISSFFVLFSVLMFSQNAGKSEGSKTDSVLLQSVKLLDEYMQNNNSNITTVLCEDVSFGHSNGWVQNFEDFKNDIQSKKVVYNKISQTGITEYKKNKKVAIIRRTLNVLGSYKGEKFTLNLSVLEIWRKQHKIWKLWSRQSVQIKS